MSTRVMVTLPDDVYHRAAHLAQLASRDVADLLAEAITLSPSNVHLVLDFLGHDFRSRDVVTIFVCCSLRWFLLGTARMLLVTS
jgi:hypothetical protein